MRLHDYQGPRDYSWSPSDSTRINLLQFHLALQMREPCLGFYLFFFLVNYIANGPSAVKDTLINSKIILQMSHYVRNAIICLRYYNRTKRGSLNCPQSWKNLQGEEMKRNDINEEVSH